MSENLVGEEQDELLKHLERWSKNPVHLRTASSSVYRDSSVNSTSDRYFEAGTQNEVDSRSVFVRNISLSVSANSLEELFKTFGTINRLTLYSKRIKDTIKGYAYIEFESSTAANKSLVLNKTVMGGQNLEVKKKRTNVSGWEKARHDKKTAR
ncbi:LANO_0H19482g1_1 [Lachancea nothofagi CBS 11611]|uniref:LANO_0H19482g1_1 n=1 Tax=Lachancea nothofagi CBS 11611 TaxID=1266666 RepID=A0A1G4KND3_9SACH|nr:LANO_0H19482g1_1 [Lachancea nothofagi CBS 11611]